MTETLTPTFQVEQITPDFAERVLETKNTKNRSFKPANLKRLISSIDNGEWTITNQGIAFDKEGNLLDGQHRLLAIIKTGKTLPIMVARNMNPKIFNCIDTGSARTAADGLFIKGSAKSKHLAAGIKVYLLYHTYPRGTWRNVVVPTHVEIHDEYERQKELWDKIMDQMAIYHRKFHCFNLSVGVPLYKLVLEKNYSVKILSEFFTQFSEGTNLEIDNPILSFRNQMMQKGFRVRGSFYQRYQLNAFIRLFNFHVNATKKTRFMAPPSDIAEVLTIQNPTPDQTEVII
tara:strand:+ start:5059 stop:5922 length:864 start_codon:yes stop_codon:yes gene_type:complete